MGKLCKNQKLKGISPCLHIVATCYNYISFCDIATNFTALSNIFCLFGEEFSVTPCVMPVFCVA